LYDYSAERRIRVTFRTVNKRIIKETFVEKNTEFKEIKSIYHVRYVVTYKGDIQRESRIQRVTGDRSCYQNTKAREDIHEVKAYKMNDAKSPKYARAV